MKKLTIFAICIIVAIASTSAQANRDSIFTYVEEMPVPPSNMQKFLAENIVYPEDAKEKDIEGRVVVRFVVDKDGTVISPEILKSVHPSIDSEALRVIRISPKWKAAKQNGDWVKVYYSLPISFRLDEHQVVHLVVPQKGHRSAYAEKLPQPTVDLKQFFDKNIQYPQDALEGGVYGNVGVTIVIEQDGKVGSAKISRSVFPSLDQEAIRLMLSLPNWKPAIVFGKPTAIFLDLNVKFVNPLEQKDSIFLNDSNKVIGDFVEEMPIPTVSILKFVEENMRYVPKALELGVEGHVVVHFTVDCRGNVRDVFTPDPLNVYLDREARRVISILPQWKPAKSDGVAINVRYIFPIEYKIE